MRRVLAALAMAVLGAGAPAPGRAQDVPAPDVVALIRARDWVRADAAAGTFADPVVRKLVLFYRLLSPGAASLAEIRAFLAANPDWPMQTGLAHRRDDALSDDPDDMAVISACRDTPPQAATALARCAQANLAQAGQVQDSAVEAGRFAQAAWVAADPDPAWEAAFLRGWAPEIGPPQQWDRFERLAWSEPGEAGKVVGRLAPEDRQAAEAWLALRRDDPHAADLAASVTPVRRDDPVMVLELLRWQRRARHEAVCVTMWAGAGIAAERGTSPAHRPAFWDERNILARRLLRGGDPAGALALTATTAQTAPEQVADAAFLAGWIALRRLGDPAHARSQFDTLTRVSTALLTRSRGLYWLGRAAQAAGDEAAASHAFAAAAGYVGTFYGQIAGGDDAALAARIVAARDPSWDRAQAAAFADRELSRAAFWLVAWGEPRRASSFLLRLPEVSHAPAEAMPVELSLAAHLAVGFGLPEIAVALARRAGRVGVALPQAGWPIAAAIPADPAVDAALALGVIRQESSFDTGTISPAGARGLMQLMPGTAAQMARQIGLDIPAAAWPTSLVADPALNIRLGTAYLRLVMDRFADAVPLAVAAYNAGPARVTEWVASNGDPRTGAPDMIDWIEMIPFGETRNYVQRVIENTVIYRARLDEKPEHPLGRWPRSPA